MPIVLLWLGTYWVLKNPDAPLLLQVWTLPEHFLLEVLGESILYHPPRIAQFASTQRGA